MASRLRFLTGKRRGHDADGGRRTPSVTMGPTMILRWPVLRSAFRCRTGPNGLTWGSQTPGPSWSPLRGCQQGSAVRSPG